MDAAAIMASHREPVAGQAFKAGQLGSIKGTIKVSKIASKKQRPRGLGQGMGTRKRIYRWAGPFGFRVSSSGFRNWGFGFRVER